MTDGQVTNTNPIAPTDLARRRGTDSVTFAKSKVVGVSVEYPAVWYTYLNDLIRRIC